MGKTITLPTYIVGIMYDVDKKMKELEETRANLLSLYLKAEGVDGNWKVTSDWKALVLIEPENESK